MISNIYTHITKFEHKVILKHFYVISIDTRSVEAFRGNF